MPKFQLTVNGSNFLVQFHATHARRKHGFYTKFLLEADTPEEAEKAVIACLQTDEDILTVLRNQPGDDPTVEVEKILVIAKWPKAARPRIGLVWYSEDGQPFEGTTTKRYRRSHAAP